MKNLPRKPAGSGSLLVWMRDLVSAVESRQLLPGTGYKLKEYPRGVVLEIAPGVTSGSTEIVICNPDTGESETWAISGNKIS
jgi:hypothetical protein